MRQRLIAGLGNPGQEYEQTRHNAGFLLLDRLIERYDARLSREGSNYVLWTVERDDLTLFLLKPLTYMNLSGHALAAFFERHTLAAQDVLVAYDDIALPLGQLRARAAGSAGGQKGMRHIIEVLNTREVPRLRIGIDGPSRGGLPLPDYVLAPFSEDEASLLNLMLDDACDAVRIWIEEGMAAAMAAYNGKARIQDTNRDMDSDRGEEVAELESQTKGIPVESNGGVS